MRAVTAFFIALGLLLAPALTSAWGMDVHRLITRRAVDGLPPPLKAYFAAKADFISEHSVDPDLWRVVDVRGDLGNEDPNHFLDLDGYGEPAPFTRLPREWPAVVATYGAEVANRNGRLPWRTEEIFGLLVKAFQGIPTGTPPYAGDNARYLSAVLAHYVEDAHVPFHAVVASDGQATNQRGIHARFENDLVLRTLKTFTLTPVKIVPVANIRDFVFDTLVQSNALAPQVLAADKKATLASPRYDDAYYAAFAAAGAKSVAETRYNDAASAVASAIVSAWEKAGRPAMPAPDVPVASGRIGRHGGGRL
jgi:hypothetical protein